MSLLNGIAGLGSGLGAFAGAAINEELARGKSPLLNSTPRVPAAATRQESTPTAFTPSEPAPSEAATPAVATAVTPAAAQTPAGAADISAIRPELTRIAAPGGARFTVAAAAAAKFQGLITDLETAGYKIDPAISGGYNPRTIAGTETPSQHAHGLAIDVNTARNQRGAKTASDIPADLARALAAKYGLTWGGDWRGDTRDPMHFELGASS